jgi:hypothetical protein
MHCPSYHWHCCFCLGFETWTDPNNPSQGYITWQSDGQQTARLGATAMEPDQDPATGSGVGQRLIPEEPMVSLFTPSCRTTDAHSSSSYIGHRFELGDVT